MYAQINATFDHAFARIERQYHEPRQQARPIYYCACCEEGIGFDQFAYRLGDDVYCESCIESMRFSVSEEAPDER